MTFSLALHIMFAGNEGVLLLNFLEVKNVFFWAKMLMVLWYLLITEKILFWSFREWKIRSFFEPKRWWKDNGYWLIKVLVLNFSVLGKYGLLLSQEVDGKIIFTGYREFLVLNFSVMGNTVFFSAKTLMERLYIYLVVLKFPWFSGTWEIWFFVQCFSSSEKTPLFIALVKLADIKYEEKVFIVFCNFCWNMTLLCSFWSI